MATATQTETAMAAMARTPPPSPLRKRFSYISPARAVVSIIAPKRHSSHSDFSTLNATQKRRAVSTPVRVVESKETQPDGESVAFPASSSNPNTSANANLLTAAARPLTFPHVANIFVKMRRMQKKAKEHHIDSTSGPVSITHPSILSAFGDTDVLKKRARLEVQDEFVCVDGVDVPRLLRASRASLLDRASLFHANILVDEQWSCSICGPKHRSDGSFKVHIRYTATAACSSLRDPRQPIAVERVSGVPGLMTITSRDIVSTNVVEIYQDS